MSTRRVWASLLACVLSACNSLPEVTVDQVFHLAECPEGFACEKFADGISRVTLEACVDDVLEPRSNEQLTLSLSSGRWEGMDPTSRSISQSIQAEPCVRPTFITGSDFTTVRVDAELKGLRRALEIALQPSPIVDVELSNVPLPLKAGLQNQLHLRVDARNNGTPTRGTYVRLSATVEPGGAQAGIWPDRTFLEGSGAATAQLLTTPEATQVRVKVQVYLPEPGANSPAFEKTLALPVAPPPES